MKGEQSISDELRLSLGSGGTPFLEDIFHQNSRVEGFFVKALYEKVCNFTALVDHERTCYDFAMIEMLWHDYFPMLGLGRRNMFG